jgi:hypothetical protein
LAKSIIGNRLLGSLNVYKFGLCPAAEASSQKRISCEDLLQFLTGKSHESVLAILCFTVFDMFWQKYIIAKG